MSQKQFESVVPQDELNKLQKQAEKEANKEMQPDFKNKLNLESQARTVIKDKLAARIKLKFKNDWKIDFYKIKLQRNTAIAKKLKSLIIK